MDSNYICRGCVSPDLKWQETTIERTDAAGISNSRARSQNKARDLMKQLQAHFSRSNDPIWVAVQNRGEDDPDQVPPTSPSHPLPALTSMARVHLTPYKPLTPPRPP